MFGQGKLLQSLFVEMSRSTGASLKVRARRERAWRDFRWSIWNRPIWNAKFWWRAWREGNLGRYVSIMVRCWIHVRLGGPVPRECRKDLLEA
jgi:hypothetical protein